MLRASIQMATPTKDYYGLKILFSFIILLILLSFTSFYLIQNYYSKSFFNMSTPEDLYFLDSNTLKAMYNKNNMDYTNHEKEIAYFQKLAQDQHYTIHTISADKLQNIPKDSFLIALDMMSLSKKEITDIEQFVNNGGKILFNFTSGFLDKSLNYRSDNLVHQITGFTLNPKINTIKIDSQSSTFLSTRLASPLTQNLPMGQAIDFNVYDPLPIFDVQKKIKPDAYLTTWAQTNYINISKKQELNAEESALIWHGTKGKGKWIYFTFPSYVFMQTPQHFYTELFKGMLSYLKNTISIVPYPYIDSKNIVFVSEDTEYKFENLKHFYDISLKHKFPVTAFCVAKLAKEHPLLMKEVASSPYLEIGSHSYSHAKIVGQSDAVYKKETLGSKKILEKLTGKKVIGFRAPREEIDEKLTQLLNIGGYKYTLYQTENRLTPFFNQNGVLIIPRHATDDYSYLIQLDWSSQQILDNMIKELNTVINLDGIYTLSVHTHLMAYGTNIQILDKFFHYVQSNPNMHAMNGKMIYKRINQRRYLKFSTKITAKKIIVTLVNNNKDSVKNLHYELFVDPTITLENVESEIVGLDVQLKKRADHQYLLLVKSLKPRSKITLFLNYVQNN